MKFMSEKSGHGGEKPCPQGGLQLFLVVCAGSGDDDLFWGDNERALCSSTTVEHLLHHGLEGLDHFAFRDILGDALDLVAFQRLSIVDGNGDLTAVCGQILQGSVEEYITDHQLAIDCIAVRSFGFGSFFCYATAPFCRRATDALGTIYKFTENYL